MKTVIGQDRQAGEHQTERKEKKSLRRHDGSLCTQKQPENATIKAALMKSDPEVGQLRQQTFALKYPSVSRSTAVVTSYDRK